MQGMMMGGMGPMRNHFEFSHMDEFAEREREEMGLNMKIGTASPMEISPGSGGSLAGRTSNTLDDAKGGGDVAEGDLLGDLSHFSFNTNVNEPGHAAASVGSSFTGDRNGMMDAESTLAASPGNQGGVGSNSEHEHFVRRRNRKLSASNPVPHVRRQAKLALFEGFGGGGDAGGPDASFLSPAAGRAQSDEAITTKASRFPKNLIGGRGYTDYPVPAAAPLPASHRERPYRFSFYSNALPATIHARSLCELPSENQSFSDLFAGKGGIGGEVGGSSEVPTPARKLGADSESGSFGARRGSSGKETPINPSDLSVPKPKQSLLSKAAGLANGGLLPAGDDSPQPPSKTASPEPEATTWWLDVLSPTDDEMRMFARVFGIHPLTTEDIQLEETREKIELFRNYYLVCFRSFDQDPYSQTYLEPLNMYIIVFREGTLSVRDQLGPRNPAAILNPSVMSTVSFPRHSSPAERAT
jgi:magnesium transporter